MTTKSTNGDLMIGETSRRTGVAIETIRYYERIGVVPEPSRTQGRNRLYSANHLSRLIFIRRSRALGFSLAEIRTLVDLINNGQMTCEQVHELTVDHLQSVRRKLADLRRLEQVLNDLAGQCTKGSVPECPIVATLYGKLPAGEQP